jgi:hypothetical protein
MKYFWPIITIILIFSGCSKTYKKARSENKPILKEQIIYTYDYKFGELDTTLQSITSIKYDSLGNEIDYLQKDKFGVIKFYQKTKYNYSPNGKVKDEVRFDVDGAPIVKFIFAYDTLGNLIQQDKISGDKTTGELSTKFERTIYKYNDYRKLSLEHNITDNSKLIYVYDKNGFLISKKTYYEDRLGWVETSRNDDRGNKIYEKAVYISSRGIGNEIINVRTYIYDNLNRVIEERSFGGRGNQAFRTVNKYNEKNQIIEDITYGKFDEPNSLGKHNYNYY